MKISNRVSLPCALLVAQIAIPTSAVQAEPIKNTVPVMAMESGWYYYGEVEAGGRFFIERPPSGFGQAAAPQFWLTPQTSDSRAKFEEYGELRSWSVDSVHIASGSRDGVYALDFWANNVGYNNQSYYLDLSKVGEHYLSFGWDQTPHLLSTSAKTVFDGAGTTNLTVNDGLQANLQANVVNATAAGAAGVAARTAIEGFINNAEKSLTLGTQRDKFSAAYRNTQDANWEFNVDYSNDHKTGTKPLAMNWGSGFPSNIVEVIQPIDERIQNISASAQFIGTSFWGKRFVTNLKYSGSFYDNALTALNVENPFCLTTTGAPANCRSDLRMPLAPSNMANAFTFNNVADLPWQSRLATTVQYNMMRQDDPFVSTAINGLTPAAFPATSANAKADALLVNNILTTQITKDVKSTIKYRYYDYDNRTPELFWTNYVRADSQVVTPAPFRKNLAIGYTKQNASAELNWHALSWLRLGAMYGWEQYDRTRRDVNVTNEHTGKITADADLWDGVVARGSVAYSERRYDKYDEVAFVEDIGGQFSENLTAMRKFDIANRDRLKIEGLLEIPLSRSVTISPFVGLRNDSYPQDVTNPQNLIIGLSKDDGWNAGFDATIQVNPNVRVMLGYNYEERQRHLADCCGNAAGGLIPANIWQSDIGQRYHTYLASLDWQAIPDKLKFRFSYLFSGSSEVNDTTVCSSNAAGCTGTGTGVPFTQFPKESNQFQRFSAIAFYNVDPAFVRQMGWMGEVVVKTRYTYESNRNINWASDSMTPYIPTADQTVDLTGGGRSIFLAYYNPNYVAQMLALTVSFKW